MNSALVRLSCKRFTIFNLGAHSLAVNVEVAQRCRSTKQNVSCRTIPRIGDNERIVSATAMYLCSSEWMFHVASRNPFMGEAVAVAAGRVEPAPLEVEGRPVVAPDRTRHPARGRHIPQRKRTFFVARGMSFGQLHEDSLDTFELYVM